MLGFIAMIVFPAFDHRFGWSPVAPNVSVIGNVLIVLSFVFFFFVMKANSYAAATIQVEEGQPVIQTGPYAYVRHPMYAGVFVLLAGIPLALGSWWGVLLIIAFFPVLAWRLLDEERFLHQNLPGYTAYTQKVRCRLLPYIW
jgi:protein-S-isoprenylcysteine O-methyltransferase Ste14